MNETVSITREELRDTMKEAFCSAMTAANHFLQQGIGAQQAAGLLEQCVDLKTEEAWSQLQESERRRVAEKN